MSGLNWDKTQQLKKLDAYFRQADHRARFKDYESPSLKRDKTGSSIIKRHKKQTQPKHDNDFNIRAMKLASQLYRRLLSEPDFAGEDKKQLWELAVQEAKKTLLKEKRNGN